VKALVYDTETTGLPLFNEPSEDPRQPHIVQLAAMLVDTDSRKVLASIDLIIRPEGWFVPADTAAIHGISTERAMDEGIPAHRALGAFIDLWMLAGTRIAHNESFDARIVRIALMRHFKLCGFFTGIHELWKEAPAECTARLSSPILKLPPTAKMLAARRNHPKTPNLQEAFSFFTGSNFIDAHTALADAQACWRVWCAIKDREKPDPSAGQAATVAEEVQPA
jgi:DNA polymerase-3 subunit epsilon